MSLPHARRVPYFFMFVRRTHDVDILQRVMLPYSPRGWSSLISLEMDSCMTVSLTASFYSRDAVSRVCYIICEARFLPSELCGFP